MYYDNVLLFNFPTLYEFRFSDRLICTMCHTGCDETTSLMLLLWCNSSCVNSTHCCYYTMVSLCSVLNLKNKKVASFIACELSGFTCTHSQTMILKFSILHEAGIEISHSLLVNSCRLILIIHSLSSLTCN